MIREATDNDREAIIQLIDEIFQEYGDRVFLEGAESDLMAISDEFYGKGGQFWVYEIDHQIVGTAAVVPDDAGKAVLKRVYLHKNYRGSGIADELLQKTQDWCRKNNFGTLCFWSDTRFERAHYFYEKRGFKRGGVRQMNDGNMPYEEFYFEKNLDA